MHKHNLHTERVDYTLGSLTEDIAGVDPHKLFADWLNDAIMRRDNAGDLLEPNAMVLATINAANGFPEARTVLLKEHTSAGFIFYSNAHSRKGQDIAANPKVSLNFTWLALQRQVRISGIATQVAAATADAYFMQRPHSSQLGAWASKQSEPIANAQDLEKQFLAVKENYGNREVPRPPHWTGWCVKPQYFEFWQGRSSRLHDRLAYSLDTNGNWLLQRLQP